nr:hypothetical protein [Magnetospirillum sp. XM-1]
MSRGIAKQALIFAAKSRAAGHFGVRVGVHHNPTQARSIGAAGGQLVVDTGLALIVAGISGINYTFHMFNPFLVVMAQRRRRAADTMAMAIISRFVMSPDSGLATHAATVCRASSLTKSVMAG